MTLTAGVVVAKTFIASLFIHVLNLVCIHTKQIQLIQQLLNDCLWRGHLKVQQTVMCAPLEDGGLNMIHIKNVVHGLRVKWFQWLCADCGSSWSKFVWDDLTALIPHQLL